MKSLVIWIYVGLNIVSAFSSFEVNFKSPVTWSPDNWMKFKGSLPTLKEFTSCHWENKEYTSTKTSPIWEFCWKPQITRDELSCVAIFSAGLPITKSKTSDYSLSIRNRNGISLKTTISIDNTYHRIWNHLCLTYSNISSEISLYYNGKLIKQPKEPILPIIPGTSEMSEHIFLIGQRMDGLGAGYSASHTFFGRIAEVNIWSRVLSSCDIGKISQLENFPKGDVLEWKINNFQIKGLQISNIRKLSDHLKNNKQFLIFPKRQLRSVAIRTCSSHGGTIVTPESIDENNKVLSVLNKHKRICLNEFTVTKDPEMGVWLELEKYENEWKFFTEEFKELKLQEREMS